VQVIIAVKKIRRKFPLDLSAALAVCDWNYLRLLKLLPRSKIGNFQSIGLPNLGKLNNPVVELRVLEDFRYTTTIVMTIITSSLHHADSEPAPRTKAGASEFFKLPHLRVRLYHDACTAEVIEYQGEISFFLRAHPIKDLQPGNAIDDKQQVNELLAHWLQLCLDHGVASNDSFTLKLPTLINAYPSQQESLS
jgi:uncharacterized protein YqiB (DUF1249 family)